MALMLSSSSQRGPQAHQDQHHKERWFLLHFRTWIPWGSGKRRLMLLGSKWWPQESLGAKVPLQQCCWHTGGNQGRKTLLNDVLISTSTQCYWRNKTSVSQQEACFPWGRSDQALLQSPQVQREAPQPRWLHAAGGAELPRQPRGRAGHLEESLGIQDSAKGRLLLYYCTGTFKTVSDTNAEREKLIHTSLCYKSCRPLNYIQFILHGYLQMHSSDLLSNHIIDRVRKEAWKNTKQT